MLRITHLLIGLALAFGMLAVPAADAYSSSTRVKIHRAKLRAAMLESKDAKSRPGERCRSGNLEIAAIEAERGARVPSEVTVMIDGDVINLNDGRGSHVCR
jgi:hypothetical protein